MEGTIFLAAVYLATEHTAIGCLPREKTYMEGQIYGGKLILYVRPAGG